MNLKLKQFGPILSLAILCSMNPAMAQPRVAVLDFFNLTKDDSRDVWEAEFGQSLREQLGADSRFELLEESVVVSALTENGIDTRYVVPEQVPLFAESLNANYVVLGSFNVAEGFIAVSMRIVNGMTGALTSKFSRFGPENEKVSLQKDIASAVAEALSGLSPDEFSQISPDSGKQASPAPVVDLTTSAPAVETPVVDVSTSKPLVETSPLPTRASVPSTDLRQSSDAPTQSPEPPQPEVSNTPSHTMVPSTATKVPTPRPTNTTIPLKTPTPIIVIITPTSLAEQAVDLSRVLDRAWDLEKQGKLRQPEVIQQGPAMTSEEATRQWILANQPTVTQTVPPTPTATPEPEMWVPIEAELPSLPRSTGARSPQALNPFEPMPVLPPMPPGPRLQQQLPPMPNQAPGMQGQQFPSPQQPIVQQAPQPQPQPGPLGWLRNLFGGSPPPSTPDMSGQRAVPGTVPQGMTPQQQQQLMLQQQQQQPQLPPRQQPMRQANPQQNPAAPSAAPQSPPQRGGDPIIGFFKRLFTGGGSSQ